MKIRYEYFDLEDCHRKPDSRCRHYGCWFNFRGECKVNEQHLVDQCLEKGNCIRVME